ncbi:DUF6121 family protein [Agromyces aerolatus]|uniref:DUF6121 family protein n=1 Tax=Agromyces sp. LY-1074 TaxID=3074080 RepID=UPI002855CCFF|nr:MULTISPECIES: DUF6121 family protein [unclassified Agromyces]MDR5698411.1 DUF6121 family protein [Agromyces sp. LY-1074]MDR5704705.1 DUF6121 family protein [Agromyces sp. LY-1358]
MDARNAWVIAGFATALYLAVVVCGYGFVSLLLDVEVVADPRAGVLVGPAAVGASVAAVLVTLGLRLRKPRHMAGTVVIATVSSWLALVVVATIGHVLGTTGSVLESVLFGLGLGIGWFGLLVPAAAAVVSSLAVVVARGRAEGMERPRWPWERPGE